MEKVEDVTMEKFDEVTYTRTSDNNMPSTFGQVELTETERVQAEVALRLS